MLEIEVPCSNPFDGRASPLRFTLTGESESWCDPETLSTSLCIALGAVGRAWWDVNCTYYGTEFTPWLQTIGLTQFDSTAFFLVPAGMELVATYVVPSGRLVPSTGVDRGLTSRRRWISEPLVRMVPRATIVPKGYPPSGAYWLSPDDQVRVREQLNDSFALRSALSQDDIRTIRSALLAVYRALLRETLDLGCGGFRCNETTAAYWWPLLTRTLICPRFFGEPVSNQASTLLEELLHGYAGVLHPRDKPPYDRSAPAIAEANVYSGYLYLNYLR